MWLGCGTNSHSRSGGGSDDDGPGMGNDQSSQRNRNGGGGGGSGHENGSVNGSRFETWTGDGHHPYGVRKAPDGADDPANGRGRDGI